MMIPADFTSFNYQMSGCPNKKIKKGNRVTLLVELLTSLTSLNMLKLIHVSIPTLSTLYVLKFPDTY